MKYFDREMIGWRTASGEAVVMDAYCEHLGAHLGYGGQVEGEVIQCPFHGWQVVGRAAVTIVGGQVKHECRATAGVA